MTKVDVKKSILEENERLAAEIRRGLAERNILSLNLVSSPGAGKTTLLEKTLVALSTRHAIGLIAGDVQTENDADRLKAAGGTMVRAIVTNGACHLDARMVSQAVDQLPIDKMELLFIENVGNLVCPSSYDLGEDMKVVLVSVTEGDDKPLKYPGMFRRSSLMVVTKLDLLPYCQFDLGRVKENARKINGNLEILELSCQNGQGVDSWYNWLERRLRAKRK
jgi:hydrogenase nickel incorporation protein HypB